MILYAWRPKNQNMKWKQYCNKFNTDFKMVHIKKKKLRRKKRASQVALVVKNLPAMQET